MGDRAFAPLDFPPCFFPTGVKGTHALVGKGGQARVYHVIDLRLNPHTGNIVGPIAVKCYPREVLRGDPQKCKRVVRELLNHRRLCHNHIVGFREVRVTRNYLLIALNYVEGGSLLQRIRDKTGPLPEPLARRVFQQIVLAVDYLHRRNVANRDISLENILLKDRSNSVDLNIILCDFGLSRTKVSLERHGMRSFVGKRGYVAPEALMHLDRNSFELTTKGDIYACGVCLYKMLLGLEAWPLLPPANIDVTSLQATLVKLVCGSEEPDLRLDHCGRYLSPACKSFMTRILHTNPTRRMTMDEIWKDSWFLTDLPGERTREYNELTCSPQYIEDYCAPLQSEVDLQNRVKLAASDFQPEAMWH